jgi:hypothetical protein
MRNLDETLTLLDQLFDKEAALEIERKDLLNSPLPPAWRDEQDAQIKSRIDKLNSYKRDLLVDVLRFPPYHRRHEQAILDFHSTSKFENSVFIMTKYPDGSEAIDKELLAVITAAENAITSCGYKPHLALNKKYHPILWDNVELYLLACSRGVAIVESKYKKELNPNVAMEWGWMRAMGRDVLYLAEETFDLARADWGGLIQDKFSWANPEPAITKAIKSWLGKP